MGNQTYPTPEDVAADIAAVTASLEARQAEADEAATSEVPVAPVTNVNMPVVLAEIRAEKRRQNGYMG